MLSRRSLLIALPAAMGCRVLVRNLRGEMRGRRVAVVFPSVLEPCAEAVEGLRQRLSGDDVWLELLDLSHTTFGGDLAQEIARKPWALVAVGAEALRAVLERQCSAKTISTMTLEADGATDSASRRVAAAVYLDIPIRTMVAELRRVFPDKLRVGVIRNPRREHESQSRSPAAESALVQVAECATPEGLLPAFLSFRKKVDFVICLPDATLYNSATARPLIMASLENRLPIVGFSPAFLRAGAAVAIYPDYRDIGQQTADLVRHCLNVANCAGCESPRKVEMAVNAKIARMFGLQYGAAAKPGLLVVR